MDFSATCQSYKQRVDTVLASWMASDVVAERLNKAMAYSIAAGGKRVRPILVFATAQACTEQLCDTSLNTAAAAIEAVHSYSLIHDDLPAMDDDDLRRGRATCHIEFDEATAILAGDALQNMAYEKLSELADASLACELIRHLSFAAGARGMVAGQMLDLQAEGQSESIGLSQLRNIHQHKTGALILAAVQMGASIARVDKTTMAALEHYARAIGLAFQVQDDIIDIISDSLTLGKTQGADVVKQKSTYVSLLGVENAKLKAHSLIEEAKDALAPLGAKAHFLCQLADYIIQRRA